jgi:hypothetical protein
LGIFLDCSFVFHSPYLCLRCRGGKFVSWSLIAGLLHLFPPLFYCLLS